MISDWRGERRFGAPSFGENLRTELVPLTLIIGTSAAGGLVVVFVRVLFGGLQTLTSGAMVWSLIVLIIGESLALQAVLARRWLLAVASATFIAGLAFIVMRFATPAFTATMCALTPCIVPDPL